MDIPAGGGGYWGWGYSMAGVTMTLCLAGVTNDRGVLGTGGNPCMTGCLECPLASSVFAQSWSQTATDGAWYSTTALPSGRDRPRCLCVLRLSGSEPKTRRTGSVATSLPSNSPLVARAGNVELDRYPQLMLPGAETR